MADRMEMYRDGQTDRAIAQSEGVCEGTIYNWRRREGLIKRRRKVVDTPDFSKRMSGYRQGMNDRQLADHCGVWPENIQRWRKRRGLKSNCPSHAHLTPQMNSARRLLYSLGYSDGQIAREQNVTRNSIAVWRRTNSLPAQGKPKSPKAVRREAYRDAAFDRIRRAIGRRLPPDLADDAVGNLYLAVLDGTVSIERIEEEAKRYGNRVIGEYASKFGPRSLDEELGDEDGYCLIDSIVDERSSDWLEEMGATVW